MSRYKAYPEYRDSGVEWLGDIPKNWNVISIKRKTSIFNGATPKSDTAEFWDGDVSWITPADLGKEKSPYIVSGGRSITAEGYKSCGTTLVPRGSVVLASRAPIGTLGIAAQDLCTNQGCKSLVADTNLESKFLFYVLLSSTAQLNLLGRGTTFLELSSDELGSYKIGFPPLSDQRAIATFLDHETAKIDALIEKQQRLIELLKEKRQAVISHAVTKGLNPNAPMKDSGVEWLGEVPAHWPLKNYRYATRIYRGKFGHRPRNDPALYDGIYPFIQTGDVAQAEKRILDYKQTLNQRGAAVSQRFPAGTLVMAIAANIGDTAILDFEAYAPDSIVGFKPYQDLDLEFLRYSLMAALPALEQTSTQSTQANLNIDRIGSVQAVFPPLAEQLEIVSYLDRLIDGYAEIEERALVAIETMQERRTALISAAVTGKIDVRDWQPAAA
ncbi:restriction endonuclease subunit S [Zoogloea sp.]|uniref:restriction endonuclease subunit S n=1 Tax=Zoogloea sp. TaxID=49181 RepID=UPI0026318EA3|nr:restriction endonuclease subunit S [Zoogloea sp.]